MAASARGDADAFAALVRRYIRTTTLLATQLLGDQDDAEDVVQDAFTVVYAKANEFDGARPLAPWLYGIVRRMALNRRTRDARRARLLKLWMARTHEAHDEPDNAFSDSSERALDARLAADNAWLALASLSAMQKACFELVAVRDVPVSEVAAMYGIAESTVRQHVFRARKALAAAISGAAAVHGPGSTANEAISMKNRKNEEETHGSD